MRCTWRSRLNSSCGSRSCDRVQRSDIRLIHAGWTIAALVAMVVSCRALDPSNAPGETCQRQCKLQANFCTAEACERGCLLILDRIIEHEDGQALRCIAERARGCGDQAWASCGARVGVHVDGGPPAPPGPRDDDDKDEASEKD
jgi:hypothetical protein